MKKLILHIGFPKCASTTLQESVFFELNKDKINFIGRSRQLDKSENYILGNDLIDNPEGLRLNKESFKEGINVISDEMLLLPNSLWNWRERRVESNAAFFKSEFGGIVDEITVLVVLRKQEDWIYSNYSFNYAKLRVLGLYNTYDKVINDLSLGTKLFKEFEFEGSLDPYEKAFGKENIKFLFLEELSNMNSHSLKELAKLFDRDIKEMFSLVNNKKNVQEKTKVMSKSTISNKRLLKIWHIYNSNKVLRKLKPIINKLSFLKKTYNLTAVSEVQKNKVFTLYKDTNKSFANKYGLTEVMRDLKYF